MSFDLTKHVWRVSVYQTGCMTFWFDVYGSKRKAQREANDELQCRKRKPLQHRGSLYREMKAALILPAHGLQVQINILNLN